LYKQCFKIRNAIELLTCHFPSLYFKGCVTHCLNLLLKDCKNKWIVKKEKTIVYCIQHHHVPFKTFCHYKTNLMFQNLIKTWFATKFLMIAWLLKVKCVIEQIIINLEWTTFVNTLCNIHWHKSFTKVRYVWTNIRTSFGIIVSTLCTLVEPILGVVFLLHLPLFLLPLNFLFMGSLMF
jgi:hypothetical protein